MTVWLREDGAPEGSGAADQEAEVFLWQVTLPWRADAAGCERVLGFTASTGGLAQAVSSEVDLVKRVWTKCIRCPVL